MREGLFQEMRIRIESFLPADPARAARHGKLRLHWFDGKSNVGDVISPLVVSFLSGLEIVRCEKRDRLKLLAVGSVLGNARSGDTVWGSGFIGEDTKLRSRNLAVAAVRGPLTRGKLLRDGIPCPEVYGDPAILLPLMKPAPKVEKRFRLGIIPHYVDKDVPMPEDPAIRVIDVLSGLDAFVLALCECERIVSSSLHGIILSEAYGVPADFVALSDRVIGGEFKFRDYYLSTDRDPVSPLGPGELRRERAHPAPRFATEELMRAFPYRRG